MQLAVASQVAQEGARLIRAHFDADLSAEQLAAANAVIDLDAQEGSCPACGSPIVPGGMRCSSCGLRWG